MMGLNQTFPGTRAQPKRRLRCRALPPTARNVSAVRVTRYTVKPLALSRFLRRTAAGACKNRSAAPAAAPCFVHWTRSPPLPFGYFFSEKVAQSSSLSSLRTAVKASLGRETEPSWRIFFLPSFCFSSSFFLRVMSPP